MGKIVGIFGMSGEGKSTSTVINPDGSFDFSKEGYKGMDPASHFIINLDMKDLPFPGGMWCNENKNLLVTNDIKKIAEALTWCSKNPAIKSVSLDTLNLYLAYKEYNDRKKLSFDQWRDIANDVIEINTLCNTLLRPDQIAYIMGHIELVTDVNGKEKKVLSVIGKKSKRQPPEGFYPICLFTNMECDGDGNNTFCFETKANQSSCKSPIGMFDDFLIPNSLKLVDQKIRDYYKI
jgi:hypothetical protein